MSDNMKIIIAILVMIPLTLWLKKFFDNFESHNNSMDSKKEESDDNDSGKS